MEIIILFTALLTSSFVIFPIVGYIKQKKLTKVNGVQFLLLFFISVFYITIGSAVVGGLISAPSSYGVQVSTMTIVIVVSVVVLILSCLYLIVGAIIPHHRKRKHQDYSASRSEQHTDNQDKPAQIA
jgi:hypothetical protein